MTATAFQFHYELINQAVVLSQSPPSSLPDELLFAAVNLFDSSQGTQQIQTSPPLPFISTAVPKFRMWYDEDDEDDDDEDNKRRRPGSSIGSSSRQPTRRVIDHDYQYYQYDYDVRPVLDRISLTAEEQELFQLIREVKDQFCPTATVRIAGGWVRDKLLGERSSKDIDFVLSNMSGQEFAAIFRDYLLQKQQQQQQNSKSDSSSTSNSHRLLDYGGGKSQHLATASLKYRNFFIDFGHLRFEKYSQESRVPEVTGVASAVEDAFRRDLTVNALFYNVNSNQVEDWTERGVQDLQYKIIATPTPQPLPTLLEDPLRILRAVRFAAQLSFDMDPALRKAAADERVRRALQLKVSKARVGAEMNSLFQTRDPARGVELLLETNLMEAVFPLLLSDDDDKKNSGFQILDAATVTKDDIYCAGLQLLQRTQALVSRIFVSEDQWDESKRRYLWYASFLKPFVDMTTTTTRSLGGDGHGDRSRSKSRSKRNHRDGSVLYQLLTNELKRPVSDTKTIESVIHGAGLLLTFIKERQDVMASVHERNVIFATLVSQQDDGDDDSQLSRDHVADFRWECYKLLKRIGPLWKESLILELAASQLLSSSLLTERHLSDAVLRYEQWVELFVHRLGLDDDMLRHQQAKRSLSCMLLNGAEIQKHALPGAPHGEAFKDIMEAQEEWFVRHCHDGNHQNQDERKAALIEYLVQTFPQYSATAQHVSRSSNSGALCK